VYDLLSSSFEDPSATIVYPYVYRILNSSTRVGADGGPAVGSSNGARESTTGSPALDVRPISPPRTESSASFNRRSGSPARTSSSANGHVGPDSTPPVSEPDPDEQLTTIINHISSEKTGAMHKEGITELHQFLKAYPHKKARVDKLLESTGPAFRKYITRALATRAAEDQERDVAVLHTLSSQHISFLASSLN
jgi:cytoskeleton-associated protein 5